MQFAKQYQSAVPKVQNIKIHIINRILHRQRKNNRREKYGFSISGRCNIQKIPILHKINFKRNLFLILRYVDLSNLNAKIHPKRPRVYQLLPAY